MRKVIVGAMVSMDGVMQCAGWPGRGSDRWVQVRRLGRPAGRSGVRRRNRQDARPAVRPSARAAHLRHFRRLLAICRRRVVRRHRHDLQPGHQIRGDVQAADLTWKGSVALRDGAKDVAKLKQEDGPRFSRRAALNSCTPCSPPASSTRSVRSRSPCCWARASVCSRVRPAVCVQADAQRRLAKRDHRRDLHARWQGKDGHHWRRVRTLSRRAGASREAEAGGLVACAAAAPAL